MTTDKIVIVRIGEIGSAKYQEVTEDAIPAGAVVVLPEEYDGVVTAEREAYERRCGVQPLLGGSPQYHHLVNIGLFDLVKGAKHSYASPWLKE